MSTSPSSEAETKAESGTKVSSDLSRRLSDELFDVAAQNFKKRMSAASVSADAGGLVVVIPSIKEVCLPRPFDTMTHQFRSLCRAKP